MKNLHLPLPYYRYSEDKIYHLSDGGMGVIFRITPDAEEDNLSYGLANLYALLPPKAHIQIISHHNKKRYIAIKLGGKDNVQILFSFNSVEDSYKKNYSKLLDISARAYVILSESGLNPTYCVPDELIAFVSTVFSPKHVRLHPIVYEETPDREISDFCVEPSTAIEDKDSYTILSGLYGRSLFAKTYPSSYETFAEFNPLASWTHFCLNITKQENSDDYKSFPKVKGRVQEEKTKEFKYEMCYPQAEIERRREEGEAMYYVNYGLFSLAESEEALREVTNKRIAEHWEYGLRLQKDMKINLAALLTMLPFGWDSTTRKLLNRERTLYTDTLIKITKVLLHV